MGLRQSRLLEADASGIVSTRGKELHEEWKKKREATLAAGAKPTLAVTTATGIAHSAAASSTATDEIRVEETRRESDRPGRAAFGQLVHETILRVPFGAARSDIGRIANYVARVVGASENDAEAATIAVERALAAPIMRAAAASERAHREYPILFLLENGTLVEGIADLAFETRLDGSTRWTIVDFKTDRDLAPSLERYRAQLRLYLRGIRKATGAETSGVILWI
jgi:ATP-dependent exoDNAse (exonuclease V) beta subunit